MIIMIMITRQCYPATSPPALPATVSTLCSGIERTLAHPYTGDKYIDIYTYAQCTTIYRRGNYPDENDNDDFQ